MEEAKQSALSVESVREDADLPSGANDSITAPSTDGAGQLPDGASIRQALIQFDSLPEGEKQQRATWLLNAINSLPDVHVRGQLSQELNEKLSHWTPQEQPLEATAGAAQLQESIDAFLKSQQPLPSEAEIRESIESLTLDPKKPEIGLTKAMEIAQLIDRVEALELQRSLRRLLEDRLATLQARR